jgi:hypothetical protein
MASSEMLRRIALVRTGVSEELSASIIRTTRIGELGTIAVTSNRLLLRRNTKSSQRASVASYAQRSRFTDSCHPDDGGSMLLRNVGSYESHTA